MGESGSNQSVSIQVEESGFYQGFNIFVAAIPKVLIVALIIWVGTSPARAGAQLLEPAKLVYFLLWWLVCLCHCILYWWPVWVWRSWPSTGKMVSGQGPMSRQSSQCLPGCR